MQQINLYQPIFRKQEKVFSSRAMVEGAVLVLLGIFLFYGYGLWQTASLNKQLTATQQRQQQATNQAAQLEQLYPKQQKDPVLAKKVQQLGAEVRMKQQVMGQLADRRAGNTAGFTEQLVGLARQRPPEMWLTQVDIRKGGASLDLEGSAYEPKQIPQFLQQLAREPAFTGLEFKYFTMDRPKKQPHQIDFTLMTDKDKDQKVKQ